MKKYEFIEEGIEVCGCKLHKIRAVRDFGNVKAGDLGGFIEKEDNLSHDGDAWVFDNAHVFNDARVSNNACVYGNAQVFENASIYGNAQVYGNASVFEYARVGGNVHVFDYARIGGNARVFDDAVISDNGCVGYDARVFGHAQVLGDGYVIDNAWVFGRGYVFDHAIIYSNGRISSVNDYLYFRGIGSRGMDTTFFKSNDGDILVSCGCFKGTLSEFENQVKKTHGDNKYAKEYLECIKIVKIHFEI